MKKSVWIFLFAVLLPSAVLGWLALRSAGEQQIIFERRTAELYQKETDSLAVTVRDTVDAERRVFGETVHRLLAKGDPDALARDFTNTLADAWDVKAVGFVINRDGKLVSPSVATASKQPELQRFLLGNGGFLTSREPAIVYNWAGDNNAFRNSKLDYAKGKSPVSQGIGNTYAGGTNVGTLGGVAGKDAAQIMDLAAVNDGTARQGAPKGIASAPALKDATQAANQAPAGVSAFDFSGLTRAPGQKDGKEGLQAGMAPSGTTALAFDPQKLVEQKKQEKGSLAPVMPAQSEPLPAPKPASAPPVSALTTRAVTAAVGGKPAPPPREMPAFEMKPSAQDAPTKSAEPGDKMRGLARENEVLTKKAPEHAAAGEAAKRLAGKIDGLRSGSNSAVKAKVAKATEYDREAAAKPPQTPAAERRKEMESKDERPGRPHPTAPSSPAAMPQSAAAAPMPEPAAPMPLAGLRNSDPMQGGRNADETLAEQSKMTKSAAVALALNSAINRQVEPQQVPGVQGPVLSTVVPEEAEFRSLTEEGDEGMIARFAQDRLNLIFWLRPPEAPEMIFGCLVEAAHFSNLWKDVLERHSSLSRGNRTSLESKPEFVLAL
ncbi:MAG: hypothetical protein ABI318_04390, partial [Chthoniobacteraceae bacterium]